MELAEIIKQKIKTEGPISFHDFMEMSLYYPGSGYYTSAKEKIGAHGDYYTSSSLTPIYGAMIGRQLEEMWHILGEQEFTIVEYGAGTGMLCCDILEYLKQNERFYNKLQYCIIEKSPAMRDKEKGKVNEKVYWADSIHDIPDVTGCILSNELIDNFSVHQVVMGDELNEVFVDYNNDFVELLQPASQPLKNYFSELNINLPYGYRTEINLEAINWIGGIATELKKGFIITIDYGLTSSELYHESRKQGTLLCYNKHNINNCPYSYIGQQDITAHVNFSALQHWGAKNGLNNCGYTNQALFLLSLGVTDHLKRNMEHQLYDFNNFRKEAFLKHTLLVDMGNKFKVLIQGKGIPQKSLKGLEMPYLCA